MADKLGGWVFVPAGGGWSWRRIDPETGNDLQRSVRSFATLLECVHDATRHGYLPPGHNEPAVPARRRSPF